MSTVAKVFVVLNLLLAVAFLGAAATLLGNIESYKKTLDTERKTSTATVTELKGQIDEVKAANTLLGQQKQAATDKANAKALEADLRKTQNDQLVQDINKVNASLDNASKALLVAQTTIKEGRALVDSLQQERQQLLEKVKAAEEQATAAVKRENQATLDLENAQQALADAQTKLTNTQGELERATFRLQTYIVQHPGSDVAVEQPAQKGKILQADNETGIVVISLGSEDSVKIGFRYTVSRGTSFIADIQVTGVEAKLATARVLKGMASGPIRAGDDIMNSK